MVSFLRNLNGFPHHEKQTSVVAFGSDNQGQLKRGRLMPAKPGADEMARRRRLYIAERVWFGALAVLVLIVALAAGITVAASSQSSCGWCHAPTVESASANSHASMRCEVCHSDPSRLGILSSRIAVVDMTLATVGFGGLTGDANIDSTRCVTCHADGLPLTAVVDGLRMNHRAPTDAGWACVTCHPAAGHEIAQGRAGYTMDMCLGCHSTNPENLTTCEICHVADTSRSTERTLLSPWAVTHGPGWQSTHGMGDVTTCQGCHPADYCQRCHGDNVPHSGNYLGVHGRDVLNRPNGAQDCLGCHRDESCGECHGLDMPHPDGFLQAHSSSSGAESVADESCMRCHSQGSCDECHVRHTHPGLSPERIRQLESRPVIR